MGYWFKNFWQKCSLKIEMLNAIDNIIGSISYKNCTMIDKMQLFEQLSFGVKMISQSDAKVLDLHSKIFKNWREGENLVTCLSETESTEKIPDLTDKSDTQAKGVSDNDNDLNKSISNNNSVNDMGEDEKSLEEHKIDKFEKNVENVEAKTES